MTRCNIVSLGNIVGLAVLLTLMTGCREFSGADYLPYGHPADPGSRPGKSAGMSGSLTPEDQDVRPEIAAAAPPKTIAPGKKTNYSGHRGSH